MSEVKLECKLARNYTMENVDKAQALLLIKITPDKTVNFGRSLLNLALVIDVSGSMSGEKLECAKEAAQLVVKALSAEDRLSIVAFSDSAQVIVPARKADNKNEILSDIEGLEIIGGTCMYTGMEKGAREITKMASTESINRMILFTDGLTEGEDECLAIAQRQAKNKFTISTFGIGEEYNEDLLSAISDTTLGRIHHLENPEQIKEQFKAEIEKASATGITNATLTFQLIEGLTLDELHRIFPDIVKLDMRSLDERMYLADMGGLQTTDASCFGAKLTLPARQASRVRIGQVTLKYDIPSLKVKERTERYDVIVEYTKDRDLCGKFDREVIDYFNQLNVQNLISEATKEANAGNAAGATQKLTQAQMLTQRIGNVQMTRNLQQAMGDLEKKGTISAGAVKTIKAGSTHTVRVSEGEKSF